jgi:hypothetical protein
MGREWERHVGVGESIVCRGLSASWWLSGGLLLIQSGVKRFAQLFDKHSFAVGGGAGSMDGCGRFGGVAPVGFVYHRLLASCSLDSVRRLD